jgi:transcriptional regulator with XRE-family HTH domain
MGKKSSDSVRFGEAVRQARNAAGLTQEDLADRAGLDRSYVGGIERGERNPTLLVIAKIAAGLGISLGELFALVPSSGRGR